MDEIEQDVRGGESREVSLDAVVADAEAEWHEPHVGEDVSAPESGPTFNASWSHSASHSRPSVRHFALLPIPHSYIRLGPFYREKSIIIDKPCTLSHIIDLS